MIEIVTERMKLSWKTIRSWTIFVVAALVARNLFAPHIVYRNIDTAVVGPVVGKRKKFNIPVFYNVFLSPDADQTETSRVQALVDDQLSYLLPEIHHPLFVHSIGQENITIPNAILLGHHDVGDESITLHSLWQYCKRNTDQTIVYLHSKGSFHPSPENDLLRLFLTRSVLSPHCFKTGLGSHSGSNNDSVKCNFCTSRFSPFPHPHVSGNMWLAQCSYVAMLINPLDFNERMRSGIPHLVNHPHEEDPGVGMGRFSAEHWIASRGALLRPCDLYTNPDFVWGYDVLPDLSAYRELPSSMFALEQAPRFEWDVYSNNFQEFLYGLEHRFGEYMALYNETPQLPPSEESLDGNRSIGNIWWGWRMNEWVETAKTWNGTLPLLGLALEGTSIET